MKICGKCQKRTKTPVTIMHQYFCKKCAVTMQGVETVLHASNNPQKTLDRFFGL